MTDPINRQFTYGYATNGIDLTNVTNTTAGRTDALATYAYNPNHTVKTYITVEPTGVGPAICTTMRAKLPPSPRPLPSLA